jgi:uncharacterized protein with GYD domain
LLIAKHHQVPSPHARLPAATAFSRRSADTRQKVIDPDSSSKGDLTMATFITTLKFTDKGAREIRDSSKRAAAFKTAAKKMGVKVSGLYWTLGSFDGVIVSEASNEETVAAAMLSLSSKGNVQTSTCRAFEATDFEKIIELLGTE